MNDFIDKRTQERQQRLVPSVDSAGLPGVSTPGTGIENRPLEHLTLDEVLAVRLYVCVPEVLNHGRALVFNDWSGYSTCECLVAHPVTICS